MPRVLFVCLGNICRSPTAEGVFRHHVAARGLGSAFEIDSAGTGDWHVGDPPDRRMRAAAKRHGFTLTGAARQVTRADFTAFDHIVAMDRSNLADLEALAPSGATASLRLLRAHEDELDVPDPYYGGEAGFDEVVRIVDLACLRLLDELSP